MANVHVSASQTRSGIVFMHEISEGAASKSYGIAVAQLAGIPAHVVRRAKGFLAKLEERANTVDSPLPNLFGESLLMPPEPDPEAGEAPSAAPVDPAILALIERIGSADIDSLSPRDALKLLYELQNEARALETPAAATL